MMAVLKTVTMSVFVGKTVKELQQFFETESCEFSRIPQGWTLDLSQTAEDIDLAVDPDGLIEDREEVIQSKLHTLQRILHLKEFLPNLSLDITALPQINIFDLSHDFAIRLPDRYGTSRHVDSVTSAVHDGLC